ncbi:uncharacterized protein LOC124447007 isoform X1 [Xenia sp. Carnegie-2017]|uniref:uncharacterized protein LOC124447007 isoform X1 n=1 Tax=Xenia sp. Carnegie-2017 TaxID=2897299 RepID=UPI001F0373D6|nr:uncharacterized protein LOC124447007 isoform X1 [Xenia sp. Carnegie-2017]
MNISVTGGNTIIGDHMTVNITQTGASSEVNNAPLHITHAGSSSEVNNGAVSTEDNKIGASNWHEPDYQYFQRRELDDQLQGLRKGVPIILHGSIGVGKSSAALNYLVVNKDKYDISWLIDLKNFDSEQVVESLTKLAKEFSTNMTYKEMLTPIEKRAEELNVIFLLDNLESKNLKEEWFKDLWNVRHSIKILITTNDLILNHPLWNISEKIEVDRFDEGIEFLKKLKDGKEKKRKLCDYFGWNILGLTVSKDYIDQYKITINKYLDLLNHKVAANKVRDEEQNHKIHLYVAVQTCLENVEDEFFPVIAAVAFLSNNNIPEFLLSSQLPSSDPQINLLEMNELCKGVKSLIKITGEGDIRLFSFHSFTQHVIKDMVDEKETIKSEVLYKLSGVFMKNINKDNRFSNDDSRLHIVRKHAEIFLNKWKNEKKDDRTMIALARLAELIGFTYTREQPPLLQKLDTFFETSRNLPHKLCEVTEDDLQPVGSLKKESDDKQEIYDIPHSTYHIAENLMKKMKKKSSQIPCMTSIIYDLVYCRSLNKQDLDVFPDELKNDEKLKEIIELSQPLTQDIVNDLVEHKVAIGVEKYSHLFLAELYVSLIYSYGRNYFYHDRKTLKKPSFYVDLMKLAYCLANKINKELGPGVAVLHGYLVQISALLYLLVKDYCVENDKLVEKTAEIRKKGLETAIKCYKQLSNGQQLFFEMGILKAKNGDELFCYCEILKCYRELLAMPSNTLDDVKLIRKDGSGICCEVKRKLKLLENQECQKGKHYQQSKYRNAVANFYIQLEEEDTQVSFYKQAIEMFSISAEHARKSKKSLYQLEAVVGLADVYSRIGRIRFTALMISFCHLKQCESNENLREMLQQKPEIIERIRKIQKVNIVRAIAHLCLKKQEQRLPILEKEQKTPETNEYTTYRGSLAVDGSSQSSEEEPWQTKKAYKAIARMPRILDEQQRIPETIECTPETMECTPETSECTPDTSECTPETMECTPESSECTPDTSESTPETKECTPETSECTPDTKECTPETMECTPETSECTPDTSECTPDTSECTPETSECTPDTSECTPDTSEYTPETMECTPETSECTPDTSECTPETMECTPETSECTPDTSESTPETKECTPETSECTPDTSECTPETMECTPDTTMDKYLINLARKIPSDWKNFAIFLNISHEKIKEIEIDERGVVWQGYTMLKYWWESRHKKILWYEELANAIIASTDNRDLAEKIKNEGPAINVRYR